MESFRSSEPAAKPRGECNAAAKLCLCCEECTPLPEFASSRRTDHHPSRPGSASGSGACWLLTTDAPNPWRRRRLLQALRAAQRCSAPHPRLSCRLKLFCLNILTAAQAKVPEPQRSAWDGAFFLLYRWIAVVLKAKPCSRSLLKSPDSLFVTWRLLNFLCYSWFLVLYGS